MSQLLTTPLSIGKILDNGFRLYRSSLLIIFPILLISASFTALPQLIIAPPALPVDPTDPLAALNFTAEFFVITIISVLGTFLFLFAAIKRLSSFADGSNENFLSSVSFSLRKLPALLIATILYFIAFMLGFVLLVVPGIILMLSMSLYMYSMIIEEKGIISSLKRSHYLVWGHWWRTATIISVPWIIYIIIYMAMFGVFALFLNTGQGIENMVSPMLQAFVEIIISSLIAPLIYAISIALYHDLRLRKEGSDLELKLQNSFTQKE